MLSAVDFGVGETVEAVAGFLDGGVSNPFSGLFREFILAMMRAADTSSDVQKLLCLRRAMVRDDGVQLAFGAWGNLEPCLFYGRSE